MTGVNGAVPLKIRCVYHREMMMAQLRRPRMLGVAVVLLLWPVATMTLTAEPQAWGPFESEGTVMAIQPEQGTIRLDHEPIQGPGFFVSRMEMPFTVADPALLDGVHVGDRIRFRVSKAKTSRIIELRKLPP
jgi:Cu/Ag efflux protein CusF